MSGDFNIDSTVCAVCESPTSASPHFNAVACLACAAFFRRTVSLNITFHCSAQNQCRIFYEHRILCKSCRFSKCLNAGMQRSSVQKRKYHANIVLNDKSSEPSSNKFFEFKGEDQQPSTSRSRTPPSSNNTKTTEPITFLPYQYVGLLDHFVKEEQNASTRRKMMFSKSPTSLFYSAPIISPYVFDDLTPFTVKSHHNNLRFDQLLSYEYTKNLPGYDDLSTTDKFVIFRYAAMGFCCLDIAFITSQMELPKRDLLVYTNATYASIYDLSIGWNSEEEITSEKKQHLLLPMMKMFHERLIKPMKAITLNVVEYAALKALILWRTCYFELSSHAKALAKEHEYYLIKDLHEHYNDRTDGPERIGTVILFISNVFELYQNVIENYKKFELFNLIDLDIFLRELLVQF